MTATKISQTKPAITGKIVKTNRAASKTGDRSFLGSINVEGSGNYDRANINVNTQTRIFISSGGSKRRAASFDALKIDARIRATFSGPVLESYPVQATAEEIIIFVDEADNGNSKRSTLTDKIARSLPVTIRAVLNADYPNWRTARIIERAAEFYRSKSKEVPPQILKGDFDGDNRTDYAVNLIYAKNRKRTQAIVVFLNNGRGFTKRVLESVPFNDTDFQTGVFQTLKNKGHKGFDYEANKTFRFRTDAVEIVFFEKASAVFTYEKGRFRRIITGD